MDATSRPEPNSWSLAQRAFALLQAMRPHQWIKNLLLFAGLIFSSRFTDLEQAGRVSLAFLAFCVLSSGVYLFNDLRDVERDRHHPTKRDRPIASGRLPAQAAGVWMVVCWVVGLGSAFLIDRGLGWVALAYWTLTMGYTLGLKETPILDVALIAMGFVLRAIAGAVTIQVMISPWLIVCTFFLALFLGFAKRRHELVTLGENGSSHREALGDYSQTFLEHLLTMTMTVTIMAYAVYTILSDTAKEHPGLWYTLPFVVYALFRYYYRVERHDAGGAPEKLILQDRHVLVSILLWIACVGWIMAR